MKTWEAKFLGVSAPWWLVLQMLIPGYERATRVGVGALIMLVAFIAALTIWADSSAAPPSEMKQTIASAFLSGIAWMLAAPFVLMSLYVVMTLLQVLGVI